MNPTELTVDLEKRLGSFHLRACFQTAGGFHGLLGRSGSGKSMTLKCIAGIERPDRGRIVLGDRVLFDSTQKIDLPPQKRRIGYLFQQYALFPHMTVLENVTAGISGCSRPERRLRAMSLLERFGLAALARRYPAQLSGGQQQRTALARILAAKPEVIALDEPLSALDTALRRQLEAELAALLKDFPGPVLWVSHDIGELCRTCSVISLAEGGQISPPRNTGALLRNPGTVRAARLLGYRSFARCLPVSEGGALVLPDWNIRIPCDRTPEPGQTVVGFPALCARPDPGGILFKVLSAVPTLDTVLLRLTPAGAESGPVLELSLPGTGWTETAAVRLRFDPNALLLLRDS